MTASDDLSLQRAELVVVRPEPFNAEAPTAALREPITPTDLHFVRNNFTLPAHGGDLHVGGAVARPLTLTLEALRAMPAIEHAVTLECAGNGRLGMKPLPAGEAWGGNAVSTATWRGALLHEVLEAARPSTDGVEVVFEGADHGPYHGHSDLRFVRSLELGHAADPASEILIAYEMNGEPLTPDHGAPFRLIVPTWFAVASVKWLSTINVVTEPFAGEFQTSRYVYAWADRPSEPVQRMRVRARITDPAPGATVPPGARSIRGKAWSGTGPVTKVEVSLTGEGEWLPAQVDPPDGPYQWQDWWFRWDAPPPGRHTLRARATDAAGNVQPDIPPWNRLGYGNNAIEVVSVDVRNPA
jgi:DMSO/TMAO reductase YedYZ molybdopterin-dependent catalytic subunit